MIDVLHTTDLGVIHLVTCWPQPRLTVVAKGLFEIVPDGVMKRADAPVRFGADEPHEGNTGRLRYAADLAPFKPAADVMLVSPAVHRDGAPMVRVGVHAFEAEGQNPIAFAPIAPTAPERRSKLGTYDERWVEERWPYFPDDFDPRYFNAAPRAMQIDGHLRGNEKLVLEKVAAGHSRLVSHLPGLRVRCFRVGPDGRMAPIVMRLDTLWIDATALHAVLVWRGIMDVASEEAEDVAGLYLAVESMDEPEKSDAYHEEQRALALLSRKKAAPARPERAPRPARAKNDNKPGPSERQILSDLQDMMKQAKMPEKLIAMVAGAGTLQGALDSLHAMLDVSPERASAAIAQGMSRTKEILSKMGVDTKILDDIPLGPEAAEPGGKKRPSILSEWTRERVQAAAAAGESMEGIKLTDRDLSGLDLTGAKLKGAVLKGTRLRATCLAKADLTGAVLAGADLSGAECKQTVFEEADLTGAVAEGADLRKAKLSRAVLDEAVLKGAQLDAAEADGASFRKADLSGVRAAKTSFRGALLTGAVLEGADLRGAVLQEATLEGARGERVCLAEANLEGLRAGANVKLPRADLRSASAAGSTWSGADLQGAVLSRGTFVRADLGGAKIDGARLDGANCESANFTKSSLSGADLRRSNLAGACLDSACLEGADARGANLYEAELWRARTAGLSLDGAHVAMSKLARKTQ